MAFTLDEKRQKAFGKNLRSVREDKNLSQEEEVTSSLKMKFLK